MTPPLPSRRRSSAARAAFLDGEGTLTVREVREWARELSRFPATSPPSDMRDETPLMVAFVHRQPKRVDERDKTCPHGRHFGGHWCEECEGTRE